MNMDMDNLFVIVELQTPNGFLAILISNHMSSLSGIDKEGDLWQVMQIINLEVVIPLLWLLKLR